MPFYRTHASYSVCDKKKVEEYKERAEKGKIAQEEGEVSKSVCVCVCYIGV